MVLIEEFIYIGHSSLKIMETSPYNESILLKTTKFQENGIFLI